MRSKRVKWIGAILLILILAAAAFGLHKLRTPPEAAEKLVSVTEPMPDQQAEQFEQIFDPDEGKTAEGKAETATDRPDAVETAPATSAAAEQPAGEMELLERRAAEAGEGRSYRITQEELNGYIARKIQDKKPSGLASVTVTLSDNEITLVGKLQTSQMELKDDQELVKNLLDKTTGGVQYVTIKGQLSTEQGRGTFKITSAAINQLPLPVDILVKILGAIGRRQKTPIDIESWFPLPYGLKDVKVRTGYLVVTV